MLSYVISMLFHVISCYIFGIHLITTYSHSNYLYHQHHFSVHKGEWKGLGVLPVHQVCALEVELVSKELNHLAAILHVYAGGLIFMKKKKSFLYYFSKRKGKYFYTFNHLYSEKSSKRTN